MPKRKEYLVVDGETERRPIGKAPLVPVLARALNGPVTPITIGSYREEDCAFYQKLFDVPVQYIEFDVERGIVHLDIERKTKRR